MEIRDIMQSQVATVAPDRTLRDACKVMAARKIGSVVVIDQDGRLQGILTERDVLRAIGGGANPDHDLVAAYQTDQPVAISPDDSAEAALDLMRKHHIRHLPVVEGECVVSVVSLRDLFGWVARTLADNARRVEIERFFGDMYVEWIRGVDEVAREA